MDALNNTIDAVHSLVEDNHSADFLALDATNQVNLPKIFEVALPILKFLSTFFLVPRKWKDIILKLIAALEAFSTSAGTGQ